jgi:acetoin utilization deacetylase AcuC-like enzyme
MADPKGGHHRFRRPSREWYAASVRKRSNGFLLFDSPAPILCVSGTGREFEHGTVAGYGFTKNSPVLPGQGDEEYKRLIQRDLEPAFESFAPEVILVSAGFDGHVDDDMSDICLSTPWYTWMMTRIRAMADRYSQGRLISVLEGGYSLARLPELARQHVEVLLDE